MKSIVFRIALTFVAAHALGQPVLAEPKPPASRSGGSQSTVTPVKVKNTETPRRTVERVPLTRSGGSATSFYVTVKRS